MARIESSDPDKMEFRVTRDWRFGMALFFLFLGLALIAMPIFMYLGFEALEARTFIFLVWGCVLTAGAATRVFGSSGSVIDRRRRCVIMWRSFLWRRREYVHSLSGFNAVTVRRETQQGSQSSYTAFPIRLTCEEAEPIDVDESLDYGKARRIAEQVAAFLEFRLVDLSTGEETVRTPETLDESLRERTQHGASEISLPPVPARLRGRFEVRGRELRLYLPSSRFVRTRLGFAAALAVVATAQLLMASYDRHLGATGRIVMSLLAALVIVCALISAYSGLAGRIQIDLSPDFLRLTRGVPLMRRMEEIRAHSLKELQVVRPATEPTDTSEKRPSWYPRPENSLRAYSEENTFTFGEGLSDEELHWLKAVIEKTLTL